MDDRKDYGRLATFLSEFKGDFITLSFEEIEKIIGGSLPPSARQYQEWWSNSRTDDSHSWAHKWLAVGWERRKLDLENANVTFTRSERAGEMESSAGRNVGTKIAAQIERLIGEAEQLVSVPQVDFAMMLMKRFDVPTFLSLRVLPVLPRGR